MRYTRPHYYNQFQCIADKCPDTCCAGWQIMIDEDTLDKYLNEQGAFGSRLANSVNWQEGCFLQYQNKRCAFLNEQNLCDLVIEKGPEFLCRTCDQYPRHTEEFDGVREYSLSLSCPVAAKVILECEMPLQLIVEENEEPDPLEEEFEDFDFMLFTQLEDAREVLFSIVQNRAIPMEIRMRQALTFGRKLQQCLDEERLFDMQDVISEYEEVQLSCSDGVHWTARMNDGEDVMTSFIVRQQNEEAWYEALKENFAQFYKLERLRDEWTEVLDETHQILYGKSYSEYENIRQDFLNTFGEGGEYYERWEIMQENIVMFFLYTYFCGAVYDDCIYSKVALAIFSAIYIQELVMCSFISADKNIDGQKYVELSYRYAREVEHSDENLICLEEWFLETMEQ